MRYYIFSFLIISSLATTASAGGAPGRVYGTLVHDDGTMTVIVKHKFSSNQAYVAKVSKSGQVSGGCNREEEAAYQLRKAHTRAASKWRSGYVPPKFTCKH